MRAVVTGGSGFVGANLVRRLLHDGHEVHLLGRVTSTWRVDGIRNEVVLHDVALPDAAKVRAVLLHVRPDWLLNLAAYGAYSWQTEGRRMLDVNVVATVELLHAARDAGVAAFVHAGSSSEYGFKDHAPREDEPLEPASAYAVTKAAAARWLLGAAGEPTAVSVLRLYSVYGPWEEPGRFVPALVSAAMRGELPPLADPRTARDFVYADDAADAFVRAAVADARGAFNVGSGVQTTLADAVAAARRVFGVAAEPEWATTASRSWDTDVWVADPARIEAELGWRATTSFEAGLRATAEWLHDETAAADRY